jgi:hypothetical protein
MQPNTNYNGGQIPTFDPTQMFQMAQTIGAVANVLSPILSPIVNPVLQSFTGNQTNTATSHTSNITDGITVKTDFYPDIVKIYTNSSGTVLMSVKDLSITQQAEYFKMKYVLLVLENIIGNYERKLDGIENRSHGYTIKLQCVRFDTNKQTTVYQYRYVEYFVTNNDLFHVKDEILCIPMTEIGDSYQNEKYVINCFGITSFAQHGTEYCNTDKGEIIIYDNTKPIDSAVHIKRTVISLKKDVTYKYTYRRTEEIDNKLIKEEKNIVHESVTPLTNEQLVEIFKRLSLQSTIVEKTENKVFDELDDL